MLWFWVRVLKSMTGSSIFYLPGFFSLLWCCSDCPDETSICFVLLAKYLIKDDINTMHFITQEMITITFLRSVFFFQFFIALWLFIFTVKKKKECTCKGKHLHFMIVVVSQSKHFLIVCYVKTSFLLL